MPATDDRVVLCYHAVSEDWPATLSVDPASFEAHLEYLVSRGYRGITFSEAVGAESAGKSVAVTFDDGYRSVVEIARPIMERLGLPGTVFVVTDWMGRGPMSWPGVDHWVGGPHERELTPMSWQQARSLVDSGWEIGSHTSSHPHLTRLGDTELAEELSGSRAVCERELGVPCRSLAFPYGDRDARVVAATGAAGYSAGASLPAGNPAPDPLDWPRVGVYNGDGGVTFRLKVSPAVRRLRGSRAWGPMTKVARVLRLRSRA